jgi:hypothetical protein
MDVEEALDRLYSVPLEEFTATRNALAEEMGADGSKIKALKKPNIVAWAINQIARENSTDLDELFEATEKVRRAQRRLMSGGKASDLRQATDDRGRVVNRLTKLTEQKLRASRNAASAATLSAVRDSFVAVASDPAGAELLRKGRLTRELEPGAFVDVGGLTLVPGEEAAEEPQPEGDLAAVQRARAAVNEARAALKQARESFRDANVEALRLGKKAEEAERSAKSAREGAEFARRAAEARRGEAEEAEHALETAQRVLGDLE